MKQRTEYAVRTPRIEVLEDVLNHLTEEGWTVRQLSEPVIRGKAIHVVAIFNRTVLEGEVSHDAD